MTATDWGFDFSSTKWWGSVVVAGIVLNMIASALWLLLLHAVARFRRFRLSLLTASEIVNPVDVRFAKWLSETRDLNAALTICLAHSYDANWFAGAGFFFGTLGLAMHAYEEIAHHPEIGLAPIVLCFVAMTWAFVQFFISSRKGGRLTRVINKSGLLPVDSEWRWPPAP
jgi:hypothetical protein